MDMRALYYVAIEAAIASGENEERENEAKANENCLNQNFTIIAQKMDELEKRLCALESAG